MDVLAITIEGGGIAVRLGPPGGAPGLHVSGLAGWYGTPDGKWDLTERQLGDGAFAIEPSRVAYSSRTVTVDGYALGRTMAEALSSLAPLGAMTHRLVSIVVDDGVAETYATGALTAEVGKGVRGGAVTFTLTVVCPDPRRYGTQAHVAYMNPAASSDMGLVYSSSGVLQLPLAYGGETAAGAGTATIANGGTATAYPVITLHGNIGHVSIRDVAGTGTLAYRGSASASAPVVLDCLSRTATVNGVDVTRNLVQRTWPSIPAGGSITLSATGQGDGYIEVVSHDTYI